MLRIGRDECHRVGRIVSVYIQLIRLTDHHIAAKPCLVFTLKADAYRVRTKRKQANKKQNKQ